MFARSDTRRTHFDMLILFAFQANFMLPYHPSAIAVTKVINLFLKVNLFNVGWKGSHSWKLFSAPRPPSAAPTLRSSLTERNLYETRNRRRRKWLASVEGESSKLKDCLIRLKLLKIHFAPLPELMGSTLWILNLLSLKIPCQERNGIGFLHVNRNNFVVKAINWRRTWKTSEKVNLKSEIRCRQNAFDLPVDGFIKKRPNRQLYHSVDTFKI